MIPISEIAITGCIACGKTTVSNYLAQKGWQIIDADIITKELMSKGSDFPPIFDSMVKVFGQKDIWKDANHYDRARLSELVFSNPDRMKELDNIVIPHVWNEVLKLRTEARQNYNPDRPLTNRIAVVVPLLFEKELESFFDYIMCVSVPREVSSRRLVTDRGLTELQAEQRVSAQMWIAAKEARSNMVVYNQGSRENLIDQVDKLLSI
jgi:dephospho-CoA kinase